MRYIHLSVYDTILFWLETKRKIKYYNRNIVKNNKALLHKTKKMQGAYRGKKAFVFGNGPSINKLDPEKISLLQKKDFHVFAVNSFINSDFGKIVKPDFYVFSDPVHFGLNLHVLDKKRIDEVREDVQKVIYNKIPIFLPLEYYNVFQDYDNKYAFNDAENYFSSNVSDITKTRGYAGFTTYKALAIACYLGYDEIYICGVDNNYFKKLIVDEENNLFYENEHFYQKFSDSGIKTKVSESHAKGVAELLYIHHFFFKHLEKFNSKFTIINLDNKGLVDCFSKKHDLDVYINDFEVKNV